MISYKKITPDGPQAKIDFFAFAPVFGPTVQEPKPYDRWEERMRVEKYIIDALVRDIIVTSDEIHTYFGQLIVGPLTESQYAELDQYANTAVDKACNPPSLVLSNEVC